MPRETKPVVAVDETLGLLDIRLGRIVSAEIEPSAPQPAYKMTVDFGKFGTRVSIGRFTKQPVREIVGLEVLGILNFKPRKIGDVLSEVLILGVQYPIAASGEATFITPLCRSAKIGSKVF